METRTFNYDGKEYAMLLPAARPAMKLCNRVATLIGPTIATLGMEIKKGGMKDLASALNNVDPEKLDSLMMDAVNAAKVQCEGMNLGETVQFTKHFDENRGAVYPVCLWCLWECVRDFFPQLGAFVPMAKAAAEKAFRFQQDGKPNGG